MSGARSDVAPGGGAGIEQRYELFDGLFAWKDWSKNPFDNQNRLDKIGNQQAARIALICSFEEVNHKRFTQDGLTSPEGGDSLNRDGHARPAQLDRNDHDRAEALGAKRTVDS